jgi:hypothetical protein
MTLCHYLTVAGGMSLGELSAVACPWAEKGHSRTGVAGPGAGADDAIPRLDPASPTEGI